MKEEKEELKFLEFDDIPVSTKTFIVVTNLTFTLDKLCPPFVNIKDYVIIPKRRGRKKKLVLENPNKNLEDGAIITIEYKDDLWGVDLKKKVKRCDLCTNKALFGWQNNENLLLPVKCHEHMEEGMVKMIKKKKYFRNATTIVMMIEGKRINFKISQNGKFQITGCKFNRHAEKIIQYTWEHIKDCKDIYTMKGDHLEALFIPAMRNFDFPLGFLVNREKLDKYINTNTEYTSLLETSFGYTGVNVKIPTNKSITELVLKKYIYKDNIKEVEKVLYKDYLVTLPDKEQKKKLNKVRATTFLIFHSGKIICSSVNAEFARDNYYTFLNIIRDCEDVIREQLFV